MHDATSCDSPGLTYDKIRRHDGRDILTAYVDAVLRCLAVTLALATRGPAGL
jgi:hypothetical protein